MINLTDNDKKKIKECWLSISAIHINLSIGSYYAKRYDNYESFMELLGKKVFDIVGILCPSYYIVKQFDALISRDINDFGIFFLSWQLETGNITINGLENALRSKRDNYGIFNNVEDIMIQVKIMHFIDILFMNMDRNSGNYGFVLDEKYNGRLAVLDNGYMFYDFKRATIPMSFNNFKVFDPSSYSRKEEIEFFLKSLTDDKNIMSIIVKLFRMFNPRNFKMLMNIVKRENEISFDGYYDVLAKYIDNYKEIYNILISFGYIDKRTIWTRKRKKMDKSIYNFK